MVFVNQGQIATSLRPIGAYPAACKPYGLEADLEGRLLLHNMHE